MWQELTAPFSLKEGAEYACALHLSFMEKAVASNQVITDKFTAAGFTNVVSDLPNMRVTGTWAQPDQDDVPLPSQVTTVWVWSP